MIGLAQGNALKIPLPDQSVHCVVSSPPYWGLRQYDLDGLEGIGLETTPEEYIANMVAVGRELWRVLRDDGTFWMNLGDSYWGSGKGFGHDWGNSPKQRSNTGSLFSQTTKPATMQPHDVLKPKDLCGIPWRVALALQADGQADPIAVNTIARVRYEILAAYGDEPIPDKVIQIIEHLDDEYRDAKGNSWYLRSDVIWAKPNPMPESCTDRPTKAHEYVFLLTKRPRYFYDADAVREEATDPEYRSVEKIRPTKDPMWEHSPSGDNRGGLHNQPGGRTSRNRRTVWTIATQPYSGAHFATFPEKLVEPMIRAGTSEHGVCPECGAGWKRVVEKYTADLSYNEWRNQQDPGRWKDGGKGLKPGGEAKGGSSMKQYYRDVLGVESPPSSTTTGFAPTCTHSHDPIPATVLDPFAGSGTAGVVARRLGRRFVGLDLSAEYLQLARQRLELDALERWNSAKQEEVRPVDYNDLPLFT